MENQVCAYCGKEFSEGEGWAHVEGDSNRGVLKIEHFCCEEHKYNFFGSSRSWHPGQRWKTSQNNFASTSTCYWV